MSVAETLIRHGAEVNLKSGPIRGTPLHTAARRDNVAVGSVLLSAGADLEARDIKGETPLRRALNCRQPGTIKLLLSQPVVQEAVSTPSVENSGSLTGNAAPVGSAAEDVDNLDAVYVDSTRSLGNLDPATLLEV